MIRMLFKTFLVYFSFALALFPFLGITIYVISPFTIMILGLFKINSPLWLIEPLWPLLAVTSIFILLYTAFNFLTGKSIKSENQENINSGAIEAINDNNYPVIFKVCHDLSKEFKIPSISFYIIHDDNLNAYALGGPGYNFVYLHSGIIRKLEDEAEGINFLNSLVAHELSHLNNGDTWPNLILHFATTKIHQISHSFNLFLASTVNFLNSLGTLGQLIGSFLGLIFMLTLLGAMIVEKIIGPIQNFFDKLLDRQIEYRCDAEAVITTGSNSVSGMLFFLLQQTGPSERSWLDTHPALEKRIFKAYNKKIVTGLPIINILPMIFSVLVFFVSTLSLSVYFSEKAAWISLGSAKIGDQFASDVSNSISAGWKTVLPDLEKAISPITKETVHGTIFSWNLLYTYIDNFFVKFQNLINFRLWSWLHVTIIFIVAVLSIFLILALGKRILRFILRNSLFLIKVVIVKLKINKKTETPFDIMLPLAVDYRNLDLALTALWHGCNPKRPFNKGNESWNLSDYVKKSYDESTTWKDKSILIKLCFLYLI